MNILIINSAEKGVTNFVSPIEKIVSGAGAISTIIQYDSLPQTNISVYDGVIISGSPRGATKCDIVDYQLQFYGWVKDYEKPILGICAGHQIIGRLFGSELIRDRQKEDGDLEVHIVDSDAAKEDPIFAGINTPFTVRQAHDDSITRPNEFTLLAYSSQCNVQVIKHKDKPIYGIQFHPEILNERMILNYLAVAQSFLDN